MKKITLLLLLMILPGFMVGQNLIQDGTFSTQTGQILSSSTPWAGYSTGTPANGTQVLTDDLTGSTVGNVNNNEGSIYQDFAVTAGDTYQVNFDYRWVSGTGNYNMTIRFRRQNATAGNLPISNVTGGTINGTNDGFIANTTPDVWYNASFRLTIPVGATLGRISFFKGNGNRPFRMDNVSVRKLHTFTGSTDTDFSTASNWDTNDIPSDDDIIIPAGQNVILNGGTTVGNITIDPTAKLTINGGGSIVIGTLGSYNGDITYNRTLQANKWHFVTSPVVGATYNDTWIADNGIASGLGNNRGISTYQNGAADPNTGQWTYVQAGSSGTFETSKGYALRRSSTGTVSFTGTYPTGAKPATVSINSNAFNLVGNPYPMYLSIANFFVNNTAASSKLTEETVWIWDQSANSGTGGYVQKTSGLDGTFQIAPGQAFFISSGNASNIIFYQFNGTNQSDTFLKSTKKQVNLQIESNGVSSSTELYYLPEGTEDFDNGYDASMFTGVSSNFSLYTSQLSNGAKKLARQVIDDSNIEIYAIPIGIKAAAGQEITFSAEAMNLPEGIKVFLEDRENNTITRLDEANTSYKIVLTDALDGTGRFFLHTKSSGVLSTENATLENVSIYKTSNTTLRVVGLENGTTSNIKIYNVTGKQVMNSNFQSKGAVDISMPKLATGMYIVQLQNENGKIYKKIILE